MNFYKALRTIALRNVMLDTEDFHRREVFRWYARTYGLTPLDVEALPTEHVFLDYYESMYMGMKEEEREDERQRLLETDEQRQERERLEDETSVGDAAFQEMTRKQVEEQRRREQIDQGQKTISDRPAEAPPLLPMPEIELPSTLPSVATAPNISMKFATPEEFDALLEGHGTMTQPE
jgi:SHS2 domain-containing protein